MMFINVSIMLILQYIKKIMNTFTVVLINSIHSSNSIIIIIMLNYYYIFIKSLCTSRNITINSNK